MWIGAVLTLLVSTMTAQLYDEVCSVLAAQHRIVLLFSNPLIAYSNGYMITQATTFGIDVQYL